MPSAPCNRYAAGPGLPSPPSGRSAGLSGGRVLVHSPHSRTFEGGAGAATIDPEKTMGELLSLVRTAVGEAPKIRAVLLECTMLPAFADALRQELRPPVLA